MKKAKTKKRLFFFILFLLLTAVEVLIGKYMHDAFIRPYGGDVLVVIVIWAAVRTVFPDGMPFLPYAVFLFACAVECAQGLRIFELLGLTRYPLLRIMLGTSFSFVDILSYAAGCFVCCLWEIKELKKRK